MNNAALIELIEHDSHGSAIECVAEEAANWLGMCSLAGSASAVLPGGPSLYVMLKLLASQPIRWDRVTVTTTDECKVLKGHAYPNISTICSAFEGEPAERAMIVPIKDRYAHCRVRMPFDLLVLEIKKDGRIASLFPKSNYGFGSDLPIIEVAPDLPHVQGSAPRWSWTLPALSSARHTIILCSGSEKRAVVDAALRSSAGPLGAFLSISQGTVAIHSTEAV
ncbi:6-phosphogluconolactonase [Novosphingobium aquae]|uniref:6-phosphogluconolactonase n=1 Tax=Novosphingobium aquae TaxID=3133435 RepID=A0ABU8SAL6_9SPHN